MKKVALLICLLLSLLLFFCAPIDYDWLFCALCTIIALITSVIIIRDDSKRINIFNFNLVFLFSLFCCSFVFPVFLIGSKSIIGTQLIYEIGTLKYVNRCSAICALAVTSYGLAYYVNRNNSIHICVDLKYKSSHIYHSSKLLFILVLLLKAISVYTFREENPDSINNSSTPYLDMVFTVMVPIYFVSASYYFKFHNLRKSLCKIFLDNKIIFLLLLFLLVSNVIIGDRGPIIVLLMSLFAVLSLFLIQIKVRHILFVALIGIVLMFGLRMTRVGANSLRDNDLSTVVTIAGDAIEKSASPWDLLSDLIGISYELNEGMIMTEKHGHLYPMPNVIRYVASPIPFLSTYLIKNVYGLEIEDVGAGSVIGKATMTNAGNHVVIDLYMPFGVIGVLVGFLFFGWFMAKISNGYKRNLFCSFFYVYAISMALYTPRSSFLIFFKTIFLEFILYFLILQFSNIRRTRKKSL